MIITKHITVEGMTHKFINPYDWTDEMLDIFVKRILRKTKSRRIIGVEYDSSTISILMGVTSITFNIEVGKPVKMSGKDRKDTLRSMLVDERVIASI